MGNSMRDLIRDLRLRRALTQEQLAALLGVTASAESKWEMSKNAKMPDARSALRLVKAGVAIDDMIHAYEQGR